MYLPEKLLEDATEMARKAGEVQLRYFRGTHLDIQTKLNNSDIVTAADKAAEKMITDTVTALYPDTDILSEESGATAGRTQSSGLRWVIDPLDGTTNFSQGLPLFSVSIALEKDGETLLGVVYAPYLQEMFTAVKGRGAFLNGRRISCGTKTDLSQAVIATGFPVDKDSNPDNNIDNVARVTPRVRGMRRLGSAALDLCYVAAGFLDGYWEMNLHEWDVAAGRLIAAESGARYEIWRPDRNICAIAASPGIFPSLRNCLRLVP